jgi:hypothetical protein
MGEVLRYQGKATEYTGKAIPRVGGAVTGTHFEGQVWAVYSGGHDSTYLTLTRLEQEMKEVKDLLATVVTKLEALEGAGEMITLRDIPLSQAKDEIALYFRQNDGKEIEYDELVSKLRIDPKTIIFACEELEKEGKIG